MKKINSLLTFVIFFSPTCYAALPSQSPYNIGPEGRTV